MNDASEYVNGASEWSKVAYCEASECSEGPVFEGVQDVQEVAACVLLCRFHVST